MAFLVDGGAVPCYLLVYNFNFLDRAHPDTLKLYNSSCINLPSTKTQTQGFGLCEVMLAMLECSTGRLSLCISSKEVQA